MLRILIVGVIWGYMGLFAARTALEVSHGLLVTGLSAFFLTALVLFVCIVAWPQPNVPRRIVGMLADTGGATFYMFLGEDFGASMIAVYLFVTFGNGFRFGRKHLFTCQALSLIGLLSALAYVPFWREHRPIGIALLISLVVLPLYVSTLLKRIQEARQRAEEANQAKTSFLANMSHEIRTPLNGIVGVVDLLTTTSLTQQQSDLVRLLKQSVKVLRSLVDDVLDITKIEAGLLTIEKAPFDLYVTVGELTELLRPHAESKSLRLSSNIDPNIDYSLQGDAHHLRQVLLNLIGNAIKFTDAGEVSLSLTCVDHSEKGVSVRFEVRDTGIGIPEDALGRIFDRFVQADQSTTRRFGGTGLGTTIAKQLVEHMGGSIGVESELGVGSLFWFELPFTLAGADESAHQTASAEDSTCILISDRDDSASIRKLIEASGENCITITSVPEFHEIAARERLAGRSVRAVILYLHTDIACSSLGSIRAVIHSDRYAVIYIPTSELSFVDKTRISSFGQITILGRPMSARALRNAIHATNVDMSTSEDEARTLAKFLEHPRKAGTILVADDNLTNQTIIKELLERAGHKVFVASNGEQALDMYEAENPDLAILDFNMPQRSGCEVIQAIRVLELPSERTPAIILSASVTQEARDRASRSGADAFVGKPFDVRQLLATIDRLLPGQIQRLPAAGCVNPIAGRLPHSAQEECTSVLPSTRTEDPSHHEAPDQFVSSIHWGRVAQLESISRNTYFVGELLRGFKDDSERLLLEIQLAVERGDRVAMGDAVHGLKGAAVGVGATDLASHCSKYEACVQRDNFPSAELAKIPDSLRASYYMTINQLSAYMLRKHNVSLITSS